LVLVGTLTSWRCSGGRRLLLPPPIKFFSPPAPSSPLSPFPFFSDLYPQLPPKYRPTKPKLSLFLARPLQFPFSGSPDESTFPRFSPALPPFFLARMLFVGGYPFFPIRELVRPDGTNPGVKIAGKQTYCFFQGVLGPNSLFSPFTAPPSFPPYPSAELVKPIFQRGTTVLGGHPPPPQLPYPPFSPAPFPLDRFFFHWIGAK